MSAHDVRDTDFAPLAWLKWTKKYPEATRACEHVTKGLVVTDR